MEPIKHLYEYVSSLNVDYGKTTIPVVVAVAFAAWRYVERKWNARRNQRIWEKRKEIEHTNDVELRVLDAFLEALRDGSPDQVSAAASALVEVRATREGGGVEDSVGRSWGDESRIDDDETKGQEVGRAVVAVDPGRGGTGDDTYGKSCDHQRNGTGKD